MPRVRARVVVVVVVVVVRIRPNVRMSALSERLWILVVRAVVVVVVRVARYATASRRQTTGAGPGAWSGSEAPREGSES